MRHPLLSVIIPVYNVRGYIRDAVNSIIEQNLGFEDKIEIILVNDGSTDGSDAVCREYEQKYPDNVRFINQPNAGVSRARNTGLAAARGEYVHFLDADDRLSNNFYEKTIGFLRGHNEVDFAAAKIMFFGAIIDQHPLNYKFYSTRVINVFEEPDNPILHITTCVFRRKAIGDHRFDERLRITEDSRLISEILLQKKAYGVVRGATYYYRKRGDESSAIGGKYKREDFYTTTPELAYRAMMDEWKTDDGHVARFMQHTILYDISYRLNQTSQPILSDQQEQAYKDRISALIQEMDDEVIITRNNLELYKKIYALKLKYGQEFNDMLTVDKGNYVFNGKVLARIKDTTIHFDFIHSKGDDMYTIEGYISSDLMRPDDTLVIEVGGHQYVASMVPRTQREKSFLGDLLYTGGAFEVTLRYDAQKSQAIIPKITSSDKQYGVAFPTTGIFTGLSNLRTSYKVKEKTILRKGLRHTYFHPKTTIRSISYEAVYLLRILINWKLGLAVEQIGKLLSRNLKQLSLKAKVFEVLKPFLIVAEAIAMIPRAILLRIAYFVARTRMSRPIWIISDRGMAAGDSGEALFRYIQSRKDVPSDVYFAISKKSKDYGRISKIGPTLNQVSLRYKLFFLLSNKVISSHADIETTNPFIRQIDHYVDLFNFDFVFLQHGVTKDDISSWLNRFDKNAKLFITSGVKEFESILNNPYYYDKNVVVRTGLPRFDLLDSQPAGKLILAPTYRKKLATMKTDKSGARGYSPSFKNSAYYTFYDNLMNDERIKKALVDNGMLGELYLHPALEAQRRDFHQNSAFKVMDFPYDYQTAFKEGNMLISDHSSVVFDFAYLEKPVVYAHFDIEELFAEHSYAKAVFFTDENDGFGPVYTDYESLVDGVVAMINDKCVMSDQYQRRVEAFFGERDKNNSERVYDAVVRLNSQNSV